LTLKCDPTNGNVRRLPMIIHTTCMVLWASFLVIKYWWWCVFLKTLAMHVRSWFGAELMIFSLKYKVVFFFYDTITTRNFYNWTLIKRELTKQSCKTLVTVDFLRRGKMLLSWVIWGCISCSSLIWGCISCSSLTVDKSC
jgi:hypothetical protein